MKLTSIEDLKDDANKAVILEAEWNIANHFEEWLDSDEEDDGSHRQPGVHASELNTCKRMVVYTLYKTDKVRRVPKDMKKRFLVGSAIHGMLQSQFHAMVKAKGGMISFDEEVKTGNTPLGRKYDIQSSCDGVFTVFSKDAAGVFMPMLRIGLEIKSMAPNTYAGTNKPLQKHVEQAHVYQACLDLPLIWYLYWNKGNQNYTPMRSPWLIPFDPSIWTKLETRAKECLEAAESEQLPEREEGQHCSWCVYAHTCKPTTAAARGSSFTPNQHILNARKR